jgi:hypothetical protein
MQKYYRVIIPVICSFFILSAGVSQNKKSAAKILKNINIPKIEKLDVLNSEHRETNISVSPDDKYIYFESERPSEWSTKNFNNSGKYDQDIWYSKKENGKWQKPENPGRVINSPSGEGEPNISPDGQTLYFQSFKTDWKTTGGPYYRAELKGDKWVNPTGLGGGINEFFILKDNASSGSSMGTDGASFSADGKKLFLAFGENYYGNMDIYVSKKSDDGKWSFPEKLPINTQFNERCPFLAADGKTLYFASNGYDGFGKMDIYKTTLNEDGSRGEVVNLGEPFNTKEDDYGFVLTSNGDDVYFVRNGDIYYVNMKNVDSEIKPAHTIILHGIIRDSVTKTPLEASVEVRDINNNIEAGSSRSNAKTGEYSIIITGGKNYYVHVNRADYLTYNREFKTTNSLSEKDLVVDINLVKPITQKVIIPDTLTVIKNDKQNKQDTLLPDIFCPSKLGGLKYSIGINPVYPYILGLKGEILYNDFSIMLGGMYLPNVGEYDDPKPPDNLMKDNYSTTFIMMGMYNITSLSCKFYPVIGVFTGIKTRYWKKPIPPWSNNIQSGSYTDHPYGFLIGAKLFLYENFYLEGALSFGKFAYHDLVTGEITKHEFKYIPWFAICYLF